MAIYSFDTSDANVPDQASGIAGNGFTWSQLGTTTLSLFANSTYVTRLSLWSAPGIASPTTGAATITFPVNQGGIGWAWSEIAEAGNIVQTVTNNNASQSSATDTSLTVTLAAFSNVANGAYVAFAQYGWNGDAAITPDTGWTELHEVFNGSVGGLETQWRATNDTTAVMTSSLGDWYGGIACEFAVATVSYTLTAAQGSFALGGQTAALRVTRRAAAAQGAFALNGQTAAPRVGYRVPAAQGSFALSGQAATLGVTGSPVLVAAQGAFALNGQTVATRAARRVSAVQGSLALAGQAAVLFVSAISAQGAFALNGQVAALRVTRRAVAAQGSLVLNGQDATLLADTVSVGNHVLDFDIDGTGGTSITTPGITTQAAGSGFVISVGRGLLSGHVAPTDSKGNTYSQLGSAHAYTLWPLSGTALYASLAGTGGASHTFSVAKPSNDETTIAVVEVKGGKRVQDQGWNEVLSGSPQTSPSVVTTGPATLIAFRWGDGNLGTTHDATPNNGFTVVDKVITDTTLVQCVVAVKDVVAPGTYNVTWTPVSPSNEGAQHWLIAIQAGFAGTLVAGLGSFALNGQAATLRIGHALLAAQGSFSLGGQAATFHLGHALPAGQASLALNGQTARLLDGYKIGAAVAPFALSGQAATFHDTYVLSAAVGARALNGQAAGLLEGHRLAAAQGALALTGQDALFSTEPRMVAASGAFSLNGQASLPKVTRLLLAGTASFVFTGEPAGPHVGHRVAGALGSFTLGGQAANLGVTAGDRVLVAAQASFALTGQSANLIARLIVFPTVDVRPGQTPTGTYARVDGAQGPGSLTVGGTKATITPR